MTNAKLIRQLSALGIQLSMAVTSSYDQSLVEYNKAVSDLKLALRKPESPSRISTRQAKVQKMAENFMLQERSLIDELFKNKKLNILNDPCTRPLQ